MITHEEVKDELQHYVGEFGMDYYGEKHFPVTTKYLLQQEKKDRLLELYKELSFIRKFEYKKQPPSDTEILCIKEIRALEEELK